MQRCVDGQLYVQVELSWEFGTLVTWLPDDRRIKVGVTMTLVGMQGRYKVEKVYQARTKPFTYNQIRELRER